MAKRIIISGFGGVGKTTLARKYKNCVDLESGPYEYDYDGISENEYEYLKGNENRKPNKNYPQNYIDAINEACKKFDIVCVRYNGDLKVDFYDTYNLDYIVCVPTKEAYKEYVERFRKRGNSEDWIKKNKKYFKIALKRCAKFKGEIIFLEKGETLESALLKRGYKLIPKNKGGR